MADANRGWPQIVAAAADGVRDGARARRLRAVAAALLAGSAPQGEAARERDAAAWGAQLGELPSDASEAAVRERLRAGVAAGEALIWAALIDGGDPHRAGREASALVEAALAAALDWAAAAARRSFGVPRARSGEPVGAAILGVDALGGRERAVGAPVEVLLVYGSDDGGSDGGRGLARRIDLHGYHAWLFAALQRALDGAVALRRTYQPEGASGPICNSVDSVERYCESFGSTEERRAWLKLRAVAGEGGVAQGLIERVTPFVYRRALDLEHLDDLAAMRGRVAAADKVAGGSRLKFLVEALQVIHAGREPRLRGLGTRDALTALGQAGLLAAEQVPALQAAWDLALTLAHLAPLSGGDPQLEARLLGLAPDDLAERRDAASRDVEVAFAALLAGRGPGREERLVAALDPRVDEALRQAALASLGFESPALSLAHLRQLARLPHGPFHARELSRGPTLAYDLVAEAGETASPDAALAHLLTLARRVGDRGAGLFGRLAADPARRAELLEILGTSWRIARLLLRSRRSVERLVLSESEPPVRHPAELVAAFGRATGAASLVGPLEAERLRIGFHALAGRLDPAGLRRELAAVAGAAVARVLQWRATEAPPLLVIGLGALGAQRLGWGGALELLFVDAETGQDGVGLARDARAIVAALTASTPAGTLLRVATSARPGGKGGPLVATPRSLHNWVAAGAGPGAWASLLTARALVGGPAAAAVAADLVAAARRQIAARPRAFLGALARSYAAGQGAAALAALEAAGLTPADHAAAIAAAAAHFAWLEDRLALAHDRPATALALLARAPRARDGHDARQHARLARSLGRAGESIDTLWGDHRQHLAAADLIFGPVAG